MNPINTLSISDLKKAIAIREQIDALTNELNGILGGTAATAPAVRATRGYGLSAAGRAAIIAAQKARWARAKGVKQEEPKPTGRRTLSAATRKAMARAARARWARAKAAGKTRL